MKYGKALPWTVWDEFSENTISPVSSVHTVVFSVYKHNVSLCFYHQYLSQLSLPMFKLTFYKNTYMTQCKGIKLYKNQATNFSRPTWYTSFHKFCLVPFSLRFSLVLQATPFVAVRKFHLAVKTCISLSMHEGCESHFLWGEWEFRWYMSTNNFIPYLRM